MRFRPVPNMGVCIIKDMNSRQRFQETMRFGVSHRPPLFEEGLRDGVLSAWHDQGLPEQANLQDFFIIETREELEPDLWPRPDLRRWPTRLEDLAKLLRRLDPDDPKRLPENWQGCFAAWRKRQHVLMLRVQRGFFQSLGVQGWNRFYEVMTLVKDDPCLAFRMLEIQGEFDARLAERVLSEVVVDAAVFSEPIGSTHGPLISPAMYSELVLPSYRPILDVLSHYGVETIILRTYANIRSLIPGLLKAGFNCLWAVEVNSMDMDYLTLREEFGHDLRLIGGIDLDVLREDKEAIRRELQAKVLPLLAKGGYCPLADGRVREDVPWQNYRYYRELLQSLVCGP
jgi:Uroporphyrinogen decarboxylase (URO-D)